MEECNEVDSVAEESSQLVCSNCATGNRDSSFSLRNLLDGQLKGPSIKNSSRPFWRMTQAPRLYVTEHSLHLSYSETQQLCCVDRFNQLEAAMMTIAEKGGLYGRVQSHISGCIVQ